MTDMQNNDQQKDEALWMIAKKRAAFKKSLFTYVIVNLFLWAIWYFTDNTYEMMGRNSLPWPAWASLGWGLGIAIQYSGAYLFHNSNSVENEYQKLKNKS